MHHTYTNPPFFQNLLIVCSDISILMDKRKWEAHCISGDWFSLYHRVNSLFCSINHRRPVELLGLTGLYCYPALEGVQKNHTNKCGFMETWKNRHRQLENNDTELRLSKEAAVSFWSIYNTVHFIAGFQFLSPLLPVTEKWLTLGQSFYKSSIRKIVSLVFPVLFLHWWLSISFSLTLFSCF